MEQKETEDTLFWPTVYIFETLFASVALFERSVL